LRIEAINLVHFTIEMVTKEAGYEYKELEGDV